MTDTKPTQEHFGVLLQVCVFTPTTRGEFYTERGWNAGMAGHQEGYAVTPMYNNASGMSFFMTSPHAIGSTAPIDNLALRLEHPEDLSLHAERAVYVQNLKELQAKIQVRQVAARSNGSFDPYVDQIMKPRAELLVKLIDNMDDGFTHD